MPRRTGAAGTPAPRGARSGCGSPPATSSKTLGRSRRHVELVAEHGHQLGGAAVQEQRCPQLLASHRRQEGDRGVGDDAEACQPRLPGAPRAEHHEHPVGAVALDHPGDPALPLLEPPVEHGDVAVGRVQLDEPDRGDVGAREVVDGQQLGLAIAVGAVEGGQEAHHQRRGDHPREGRADGEDPGPAGERQDVAEADREEVDAGEVPAVDHRVDALEARSEPVPDKAPTDDLEPDPDHEQAQQRHRAEGTEHPLPAVEVLDALADLAPRRPGQPVERGRRPPSSLADPGRDERADGVGEGDDHQRAAEDDPDDLHRIRRWPAAPRALQRSPG